MSTTPMRYAEVEELQAAIMQQGSEPDLSANERGLFEFALDATSREIDDYCRRHFYRATLTKVFTAARAGFLLVPDLVSVTTLKHDSTGDGSFDVTWSSSDYVLEPSHAPSRAQGWPYTEVHTSHLTGSAGYTFPLTQQGVQIVGVWGWPAVPDAVRSVCLIEAARVLKIYESPSGVISLGQFGSPQTVLTAPDLHPRSRRALGPYRRMNAVTW